MTYTVEGTTYSLSYRELKERYDVIVMIPDEWFIARIAEVIHLACIICYLKEIPAEVCLSDKGIIHELAHVLDGTECDLAAVRELFKTTLKLV